LDTNFIFLFVGMDHVDWMTWILDIGVDDGILDVNGGMVDGKWWGLGLKLKLELILKLKLELGLKLGLGLELEIRL
jgi:hypothetical protein